MKFLVTLVISLSFGLSAFTNAVIAEEIKSLRGGSELDGGSTEVTVKRVQNGSEPIARDFVQQPPLIPHKVEGYEINLKFNKCLTCHSWKNYRKAGATKVSQTHFSDRQENVLANISSRRYFCNQCHVPQMDAQPLVENQFKPLQAIQ